MKLIPIILTIIGVVTLALSDKLQPDQLRKPRLNIYLGSLGGIIWLVGVVLGFFNYSILQAIGLLIVSFIIGGFLGVKSGR